MKPHRSWVVAHVNTRYYMLVRISARLQNKIHMDAWIWEFVTDRENNMVGLSILMHIFSDMCVLFQPLLSHLDNKT